MASLEHIIVETERQAERGEPHFAANVFRDLGNAFSHKIAKVGLSRWYQWMDSMEDFVVCGSRAPLPGLLVDKLAGMPTASGLVRETSCAQVISWRAGGGGAAQPVAIAMPRVMRSGPSGVTFLWRHF